MYIINVDNQHVFKTKSIYLNCYSVNSTVWKYLDELFLKPEFRAQGLATELLNVAAMEAKQNGANHLAGIISEQKP